MTQSIDTEDVAFIAIIVLGVLFAGLVGVLIWLRRRHCLILQQQQESESRFTAREPLSHLKETIEKAKLEDWSENGRCSMCAVDRPHNGVHTHKGREYACGNNEACVICRGCLPPGEICQACYRKNMEEVEC